MTLKNEKCEIKSVDLDSAWFKLSFEYNIDPHCQTFISTPGDVTVLPL